MIARALRGPGGRFARWTAAVACLAAAGLAIAVGGSATVATAPTAPAAMDHAAEGAATRAEALMKERAAKDRAPGGAPPSVPEPGGACPPEPPIEAPWVVLPTVLAPLVGERAGAFGSASIGGPTRGALWDGVELSSSDAIEHAGGYAWGTALAVRSIERAVRHVRRCYPDTPRLYVGDLSREHGGWLRPHRSHQAGLDADVGYYYTVPSTWYLRATAQNLDVPRTWALLEAFIDGGNVDTIFVDASIQRLLQAYLATLPASRRPTAGTFSSPLSRDAIIRHAWGHATHFHVRFRDAEATRRGAALARMDPLGRITRGAVPKRR